MESDSANKISKTSVTLNSNDQTNSRRRTQSKMFITLIIFFIVIIVAIISVLTMIKRDYDSELPANNPEKAIHSICMPTAAYYDTCFKYLSNHLFRNHKFGSSKITSSQIFSISLHTAIDELQKITRTLKSYQPTSSRCNYMYFNSSLSQLNSYLAIDEEKNSTAIISMRAEMIDWLYNERLKIAGCLNWLAYEKGLETENANYCLSILENMNNISEMLDPSINSVFDFDAFRRSGRSIVDLLFSDRDFVGILCIFGVQFIFLLLLVSMLVRVW